MVHILGKAHFVDRQMLARLNTAIVLGLVGSGLVGVHARRVRSMMSAGWFSVW